MCLLLESVRIERRRISLADEHNRRIHRSRRDLFGAADDWNVEDIISLPPDLTDDVYKCRILYDREVRSVEFARYTPRSVRSLRIVHAPSTFDYSYKYADRAALNKLLALRGNCDDVLIVREGVVTDTSFSNVALYDGAHWYTPAKPLLHGVRIASLLEQGVLREAEIRSGDLPAFQKLILLNAMLGMGDKVEIDVRNITE